MTSRLVAAVSVLALGGAQREAPSVEALVAKASAYAGRYASELGGLVAQETYRQDLPQQRRDLKSDFLLVRFSQDGRWIPFRDVIEVDGKRVADRDARLERLFLSADPAARDNADRIMRESSRYNLGRYYRSVNTPVIGLEYLQPDVLARSRFRSARREAVEGAEVWRVDFQERSVQTVVHDGYGGPMPASGTIWIRPSDGAVIRTIVRFQASRLWAQINVTYCAAPAIPVLVPCRMAEEYRAGGEYITSVATYTDIRQFKVATTESIKH